MVSVSFNEQELEALLKEGFAALDKNLPHSRQLAEKVLAESPSDSLQQLHGLTLLAICDFKAESYQEATHGLLNVISLYNNHEDQWLLRAYEYLGMCYHQSNLYGEAIKMHKRQCELGEKLGDQEAVAIGLRRMGADHDHMGQPRIALGYYEKSLAIYTALGNRDGMSSVIYNMSIAHSLLGNYQDALHAVERSLSVDDRRDNPKGLARIYGQLALILANLGQHDRALENTEKAIQYAHDSKLDESISLAYLRQGIVYRISGDITSSIDVLQKALRIAEENHDIHTGLDLHQELSQSYKANRQFEQALYHQEAYQRLYVQQMEEAMRSRFENLSIIHRTEQAQAEAERLSQLREQDRIYFEKLNQMKDELVSTASHDLKNPLANIMTVLYLLKRHGQLNDAWGAELLTRIENSARQMRDLITNLLDLARLETGKSLILEDKNIIAFAQEVAKEYQLLAENQGLEFVFESELDNLIMSFDSLLMRQVLVNLLSNALKFTMTGGKINLKIAQKEKSLQITIADSGIGIPEEALPHIFERFYRVEQENHRKIEGTGLGLPICKAIVEQHGGTIGVNSTGQGSQFWVLLPIS